jgi:hypothetical protein
VKPLKPVRISVDQFSNLKENKNLEEDFKVSESRKKQIVKEVEREYKEEGYEDSKVKSGGLVDLNSGFYVSPDDDATYDKELKVYSFNSAYGDIKKSGFYKSPEGYELNDQRGFVGKQG